MADETTLTDEVESGDVRRSLVALRRYLAHELEGNRCHSCQMSKLKTGDTAALVLRLQKVIEEIAAIPETSEQKSPLDELRERRELGTKSAPRQQGGRAPRRG